VRIRIQLRQASVKALQTRLQHADQKDDVRLVRRMTVLIDLFVHGVPVDTLHQRWRVSPSTIYEWRNAFLLRGLDSLVYSHGGGRPEKLTPTQKNRLTELLDAGPLDVHFTSPVPVYGLLGARASSPLLKQAGRLRSQGTGSAFTKQTSSGRL
jgi:hypothetical protein